MLEISFGSALFAGILSFLSPCILPMVPFYLCYMAGISMNEMNDDTALPKDVHWKLIRASICFALGVTTIFVLLGLGATVLGQAFRAWKQELSYVSAAILFMFGLHFLGVLKIPFLYREAKIESKASPSSMVGAYLMGLAFGFGWTPCVGPALAAILMMASGMGDPLQGGLLLLTYGIGMTFPFVLAAIFAKPFLHWVKSKSQYLGTVEKIMGLMLILFAILIATNSVNHISNFLLKYVPWFQSIG